MDGRLKANITYSTGYEKVSDWARAREIATAALKYYRECFVWLLFAWMILYFWALVTLFDFGKTNFIVISVFTVANNINTLCIWLCFDILNQEIATGDKTQDEDGLIVKEGGRLPAGLIPITGILFWFILELFLTSDPTPEASVELFHYISRVISGIAGGIAMALFVARFQSKFLKSPAWLIFILFLYTVIQALFGSGLLGVADKTFKAGERDITSFFPASCRRAGKLKQSSFTKTVLPRARLQLWYPSLSSLYPTVRCANRQ